MIVSMDILSKIFSFTFEIDSIVFTHNNFPTRVEKSIFQDTLHSFFSVKCANHWNNQFLQWFEHQKGKYSQQIAQLFDQFNAFTCDNPLAFWDKSTITIHIPMVLHSTPAKASHSRMSLEDYE